jgi:hypothetical protein
MQPQKSNSKTAIIILIVVLALAAGVYFYMSGQTSADPTSGTLQSDQASSGSGTDPDIRGAHILSLLNQIENLHIDANFFKSSAYTSLVDHTVPVYPQAVGKSNPFYNPNRKITTTTPGH